MTPAHSWNRRLRVLLTRRPSSPEFELKGRRMGAYELVRGIGRGGMGEIYLAHRADHEFRKQVAIKVIRAGLESRSPSGVSVANARFWRASSTPTSARLLDGGTSTDGLPYLVMEYIDGEPLLEYCESARPSAAPAHRTPAGCLCGDPLRAPAA